MMMIRDVFRADDGDYEIGFDAYKTVDRLAD